MRSTAKRKTTTKKNQPKEVGQLQGGGQVQREEVNYHFRHIRKYMANFIHNDTRIFANRKGILNISYQAYLILYLLNSSR